jgi:RHS repeat-associated protein
MRNVSYQYDPVGNRQQVTDSGTGVSPVWYTANNLNQYTMVGGNNLSYDTKGNLQTVPGWTYQYDAQNRLLSASSASSVVQFSYDARNRCVARTVNGNITRFVYDGWSLLEELNASGVEQCRYYHGAMIDELLLRITANTYYYHHDGLGSTIALTDSTGALAESYTYDVFGAATILTPDSRLLTSSALGNRFLFTGREYLDNIGLYDYRNRFYSQSLGRFLQTDPIRFEAKDVNLYRYVKNRIIGRKDPLGLDDPSATWNAEPCPDGQDTNFIQVVSGYWAHPRPFVDSGRFAFLGFPRKTPYYYPDTDQSWSLFEDRPEKDWGSQYEVCRVCLCKGKIVSYGPCKRWDNRGPNQDLGITPSYFPSYQFQKTVNEYYPGVLPSKHVQDIDDVG